MFLDKTNHVSGQKDKQDHIRRNILPRLGTKGNYLERAGSYQITPLLSQKFYQFTKNLNKIIRKTFTPSPPIS